MPAFDDLRQDLRFATRSLTRERMFSTLAVLMLALGIGANSAMFALARGSPRRCEIRDTADATLAVVHHRGGGHPGARHRRQQRDVRARGRNPSAALAISGS